MGPKLGFSRHGNGTIAQHLAAILGQRLTNKAPLNDPCAAPDFVGLHNMAKHIIFLKEGSDAVLATLTSMLAYHEELFQITGPNPTAQIVKATQTALSYQRELFRSVSFRIGSLDRRMQNIINLVR
jgi:hypothetical protein